MVRINGQMIPQYLICALVQSLPESLAEKYNSEIAELLITLDTYVSFMVVIIEHENPKLGLYREATTTCPTLRKSK